MPWTSAKSTSSIRLSPRHDSSGLPDIASTVGLRRNRTAHQLFDHLRKGAHAKDGLTPGTMAASRACGSGTNTRSMPRATAAIGDRQRTRDRPQPTVEGEFTDEDRASQCGRSDAARRTENCHRHREVKSSEKTYLN